MKSKVITFISDMKLSEYNQITIMGSKKTIIRKALKGNGVLPCVSGSLRILSGGCVNSKWMAEWLTTGEGCQCGFKCKVRVEISRNGHNPYQYIVDKRELYRLMKQLPLTTH